MKLYLALGLVLSLVVSSGPATAQESDKNYEKAVSAYQDSKYKEAFIHLKNALQADPNNLPARLLLAQVYFNEGELLGAEKESDQALLLGADINLILPVYGAALVLQGKADKLFEIEQVATSLTPANRFEWALLKGQGYLIKKESALARAEFEKAEAMFPADVRANNTLASIYLAQGMLEESARLIDKSIALEPDNPKTWQLRGELAQAQEDYKLALQYFSKAYSLAPEDPMILRGLAQVNMLLGDQAQMQKYLKLILQQSPDDPAATLLNAIVLMGQGNQEMGEEMLAGLSNKLSRLAEAKVLTGDNYLFIQAAADYIRGSDESAIALLNSYLSRNKDDLAAIRMLVDIYLRNGEDTQATQLLADSKAYIASDFGLTLQLLHLYIQAKNTFGAQQMLEDIKQLTPEHPYVFMLQAEYLRSSGQTEAALALINGQDYGDREPLGYGLMRGALQLDLQMEPAALVTARRLEERFPENVKVLNLTAITLLRMGKLDDAEMAIQQTLSLAQADAQARFNQAMLAKKRGQLEEAAKMLNTLLQDQPNHTNSILLMARILLEQGKYEDAIDWSRKVYAYEPDSSAPGELQLDVYTQLGDWNKALPVALQLAKQNPLNTGYLVRLANVYIELKDNDSAQRPLYKLYTLWDKNPAKLRELAALQVKSQNLEAAGKSLEKALALDAQSFETRLDLARLMLGKGSPDQASAAATQMQSMFGERSEISYLQGEVALANGDLAGAQAQFTKAFELDNDNAAAVVQLYQLSKQGVGGTAFTAMLESRLKRASLPPWAVRMLADSYLSQGNKKAAARYYESLLELPDLNKDPEILNNLANIYAATDLDKALATAQKGMREKGKNSAALLDTIGWILVRQKRPEEALPYLREAYAINSRDPEIRYHTGVTLLALGRQDEAGKELRAALASKGDFPGRAEAERLLDNLASS